MSLLESIFGGLAVLFCGLLVTTLWKMGGIPDRVNRLETTVDRHEQQFSTLTALSATMTGVIDRLDRSSDEIKGVNERLLRLLNRRREDRKDGDAS